MSNVATALVIVSSVDCAIALENAVQQRLNAMVDGPYCKCGAEIDTRQMDLDKDCDCSNPWAQQIRESEERIACRRLDREAGVIFDYDRSHWTHRYW